MSGDRDEDQLSERILQDRQHSLVSVTYCSAYQKRNSDQLVRHKKYIEALEHSGVQIQLGHYMVGSSKPCFHCGGTSEELNEKQTDINLALCLFADAMRNHFDWAYLVSADSDQAATARFLKKHFPEKKLVTVVPPNQQLSQNIMNFADGKRKLNRDDIEKCRFPSIIQTETGFIRCPREYE
ncbi:NYN domain-containing protein [Palleronia caenipelagi]|uniref:NYN domain-containing protein n=1 Tax=Palleronia caenipelagi TaxID=2489174 RepID=A0A547PK47_9RHOB|nr:NYN domain-containing protein [Palleronia caenipelagi]TRD14535.1 NYN domain-containing protein [Palleronia caenipelagi]